MRKLLLLSMLLSALLLLFPASSHAQYVVTGQGCGASGLNAIANDGTPVVCRGNPLVWTAVGGSGGGGGTSPVPGQFQSSLDPPLFQPYGPLTTTGAQPAINLTATPIDTHTISWAPTSLGAAVQDSFAYANGDLHTANANWVYQSGSFTVQNGIVYSSAAVSFAYRSDGPTAQATEWAQAVVNLTAPWGSQNIGICIRQSTAAQTGYCLHVSQYGTGGTNAVNLILWNAGAQTILASPGGNFTTGDVAMITASGTTINVYRNGSLLASVTDATIASGSTGMVGVTNAVLNGFTNFQSGTTIPACAIQLDRSQDGTNWVPAGAISSQTCFVTGSAQFSIKANYVRVNVTSLSAGSSLNVIYSGRLAPAATNGSAAPVSNGQVVQAGQVLWAQYTTQGFGNISVHQSVSIITPNGITQNTTWDVNPCATGASPGGVGTGYVVPQTGILQGFTAYVTSASIPVGAVEINLYILNSMPAGGTQTTCVSSLATSQIGQILGTWQSGSFLPASFIGTTSTFQHPWSVNGYTTTLTQSNPAAGAEWSLTISTAARTCIQNVSFTLASGSTGVTPVLVLTFNGSKLVYAAATQQSSGTTHVYSFSPGAATETVTAGSTLYHIIPFNNGQLACFNAGLSTATIGTLTTGINGTTQYSNISILAQVQQDNN